MTIGVVEEIWRYPVKSMGGERLARAEVSPAGITGDRRFGVVDRDSGKLLSAKTVPKLLEATAAFDAAGTVIAGPGFTVESNDPEVDAVLSSWLDRAVRLAAPAAGGTAVFEHQPDLDDATQVVDLRTPPGAFFDSRSVLHLLSDASLRAATVLHPGGDWDRRRFRPNLVVHLAGDGFVEDRWVGRRVVTGGVTSSVRKLTGRCILTTRPQPGLGRDGDILRSLVRERDGNLGVYLDPLEAGLVREGDAVDVA